MANTQEAILKTSFDIGARKLQKISCKIFHRKNYFTWFRELVWNIFSKIVWGNTFSSHAWPRPLEFIFSADFSSSEDPFVLKINFQGTELQQRSEFDIFWEELFCTLASSTNLVLTSFQLQRGSIYEEILLFLTENWSFLEFPCIFKELKTKREVFRESWTKHLQTFWYFSTVCPHHKWNRARLLSPESECKSCLTGCKTL